MTRRIVTVSLASVAGTIALYVLVPFDGDHPWLGVAIGCTLAVFLVPLLIWLLHAVDQSERPVVAGVAAIGMITAFAVLAPSALYVGIANASPDSFVGLDTKIDGIYYTVTLVSTAGFGDIHASSQGARLVTSLHMISSLAVFGAVVRLFVRLVGAKVGPLHHDEQ